MEDDRQPDGEKDYLRCCKNIYWYLVTKRHHLYFGQNEEVINSGSELVRLAGEHLGNSDITDEKRYEIMIGLKEQMIELLNID